MLHMLRRKIGDPYTVYCIACWHSADSFYCHCTAHYMLYEQDESGLKCVITGYDPHGFDFGEVNARGSVIAFPTSYVLWSPT
jgi:hypothetical protein